MYKIKGSPSARRSPPRGGSDRRLLDAARDMMCATGVGGLRLREVAKRAGVNLGLFHYHFGSKREFTRRLLQNIYEDFFGHLSLESHGEGGPAERLKRSLIVFGRFARDHRRIFVSLLGEALRGDKDSIAFLETNIPRHVRVVADLIAQGRKTGKFKTLPPPVAVSFAMGTMGAPNLMTAVLERSGQAGARRFLAAWREDFLSDRAVERRAELVLSALKK